eukprot:TRINITY_DN8345_c0_g4_i1.p1 TRINITY_DN8345_c0_g4~~TRINITY_DN8345_c0_g4_i1.p1  ORF type:complete len:342 (+),score=78.76 TRINITY_DN8345_c0_g4_i1:65-1090(+)
MCIRDSINAEYIGKRNKKEKEGYRKSKFFVKIPMSSTEETSTSQADKTTAPDGTTIESEEPRPSKGSHNHSHQHRPGYSATTGGSGVSGASTFVTIVKEVHFGVEGMIKIAFFFSLLLMPVYSNMIAFIINISGFLRQTKLPKWNKEYARRVFTNEFMQNLWYMLPFYFSPAPKSWVYYFPLGIHFWIGVSEFVRMRLFTTFLYTFAPFKKIIEFTKENRNLVMIQKAQIEIFMFLYSIIHGALYAGLAVILIVLFYGNFLRVKYMINNFTQYAFTQIDDYCNTIVYRGPAPIRYVYGKIRQFCKYLVTFEPPQPAAQPPAPTTNQINRSMLWPLMLDRFD